MAKNDNIQDWLKDVADSLRIKYQTRGLINPQVIPSMVERLEKKPMVNFYDYDGELLYSYDKDEFLELDEMPPLPTQSGLICQGWNRDLDRAKEYVNKYSSLNIGAMYITDDGATKLHINLTNYNTNVTLNIGQTVSNGVTINWGDGSSETASGTGNISLPHSYSTKGEYTISLLVAENCELTLGHNSTSYPVLGSGSIFLEEANFGSNIKTSQYAFYRSGVKHISFPSGGGMTDLNSFGAYTFQSCYLLQSVTIPDSVTEIRNYAFESCTSLRSVTIPDSVTEIGNYAFQNCRSLQSITIPDSVTSIGQYAFYYCTSLQSITIPDSVTSIGQYAFYYCTSLQSITIPDSVTSIGQYAFQNCTSLQSITIPNSVIGRDVFGYCRSLQNITFHNSVTSIGEYEFKSCTSLQSITIPDSVTTIGNYAFADCASLQSITIPNSVTTIGSYAFGYCYPLQSITIPDSVTAIGAAAFNQCYSLQSVTIPDSVTAIESSTFRYCYPLQSVTIPDSVTKIGDSAFSGCTSLRSITIPDSVTKIDNEAFNYCKALQIIDFTSHTSIPTLGTDVFDSTPSDLEIRVPTSLYIDWCNATNWATYKDKIKHGLLDVEDFTYNSLSIAADDVKGRKTNTTIHYTVNVTGTNRWTGEVETVDMQGTTLSDSFPQNTSTTDTVERTITFELGGLTATTTITQGVWIEKEYVINLNDQWRLSSSISNPDASLYDGVYESFSNYNVNYGYATMYIDIVGYETFKLYIRSYAESNSDYVMVSKLDQNITGSTSYSLVKAHTRGSQQSGTALSNYKLVEFTGIDKGEHRITIVYRKDGSGNSGNDRGYVFVKMNQ